MFCSSFETSQRSYAASSMVMASVSTFQDHNATPAARVAARRCFSCHTGIVTSLGDIALCFPVHSKPTYLCRPWSIDSIIPRLNVPYLRDDDASRRDEHDGASRQDEK